MHPFREQKRSHWKRTTCSVAYRAIGTRPEAWCRADLLGTVPFARTKRASVRHELHVLSDSFPWKTTCLDLGFHETGSFSLLLEMHATTHHEGVFPTLRLPSATPYGSPGNQPCRSNRRGSYREDYGSPETHVRRRDVQFVPSRMIGHANVDLFGCSSPFLPFRKVFFLGNGCVLETHNACFGCPFEATFRHVRSTWTFRKV